MTCACNRRGSTSRSAFTLVETMLGSVLAVVVFGALLVTIAHGFTVMRSSNENSVATQILLDRMEGLRLYNWNQLVSSNVIPAGFQTQSTPGGSAGTNAWLVFTNNVTISPVVLFPTSTYATNMRQVTVTVVWSRDGILRRRSMSTFVSRHGIQNTYNR